MKRQWAILVVGLRLSRIANGHELQIVIVHTIKRSDQQRRQKIFSTAVRAPGQNSAGTRWCPLKPSVCDKIRPNVIINSTIDDTSVRATDPTPPPPRHLYATPRDGSSSAPTGGGVDTQGGGGVDTQGGGGREWGWGGGRLSWSWIEKKKINGFQRGLRPP